MAITREQFARGERSRNFRTASAHRERLAEILRILRSKFDLPLHCG